MPSSCVCPSVCLSVCVCVCHNWYCMKTAKRRITQIMPLDRPGTLVSILTSASCSPSAIAELLVYAYFKTIAAPRLATTSAMFTYTTHVNTHCSVQVRKVRTNLQTCYDGLWACDTTRIFTQVYDLLACRSPASFGPASVMAYMAYMAFVIVQCNPCTLSVQRVAGISCTMLVLMVVFCSTVQTVS